MITTLFPGFLAAGAIFAAVPVLLHLLRRIPPDLEPLPTARFLRENRRTLLRLTRRPSDTPLLLVRVLFALTLGASFAGMTWVTKRSEHARVVLVDVEAASDIGIDSLLSAVRGAAASDANGAATQIVAYAVGEDGDLRTGTDVEELADAFGAPRATAIDGLRALRSTMTDEPDFDSVAVTWVMQPTWAQWTHGVGLLREALWPGAVTLLPLAESRVTRPETGSRKRSSRLRTVDFPAPVDPTIPTWDPAGIDRERKRIHRKRLPSAGWSVAFIGGSPLAEEKAETVDRNRSMKQVIEHLCEELP